MWRLGVVGSPVGHSLSPRLHEVGLSLAGRPGTAGAVDVAAADVARGRPLLATAFDALLVTMPLKSLVAPLCDEVDEIAGRTGAVNSLLARDGRLYGANTDGPGFVDSLECGMGVELAGSRVLVLGAGGAARGIVDALVTARVATIDVVARRAEQVDWLARRYDVVRPGAARSRTVDLVVNATPVPGRVDRPLEAGVGPETVAVDITYEPRMTRWRSQYERSGCRTANGLAMLAYQAARQLSWWFDVSVDGAALLEAIS